MHYSKFIKIIGKFILPIIFFTLYFVFKGILFENSLLKDITMAIILFALYFGDVFKLNFLTSVYSPEKKIGIFFYFAFIVIGTVIYNETSNSDIKDWYNWVFISVGILIPVIGFVGMRMAYYILFPSYILYIFFILPLPSEDTGGVSFLFLIVFTPLYFLLVTAVAFVLESIAQAFKFYK